MGWLYLYIFIFGIIWLLAVGEKGWLILLAVIIFSWIFYTVRDFILGGMAAKELKDFNYKKEALEIAETVNSISERQIDCPLCEGKIVISKGKVAQNCGHLPR